MHLTFSNFRSKDIFFRFSLLLVIEAEELPMTASFWSRIETFVAQVAYFVISKAVILAVVTEVGSVGAIRTTGWSTIISSYTFLMITATFTTFTIPTFILRIVLSVGFFEFMRTAMTMIAVCRFNSFFLIAVWRFGFMGGCLVFKIYWRLYQCHSFKKSMPVFGYSQVTL